ncbi:MAG: hypothetical protein J7K40_05915 [candidate division Zixibacteria bacterium]|nr:hypothetical protein [candidate division Zixibacteria bacterium]
MNLSIQAAHLPLTRIIHKKYKKVIASPLADAIGGAMTKLHIAASHAMFMNNPCQIIVSKFNKIIITTIY